MSELASISLAGMRSAQTALSASAAGVARAAMPGASPVPADARPAPAPDENLTRDLLGMLQARNALLANAAVFRTASATSATLIDLQA